MKKYYQEQVRKCEIKVALAKVGYEATIRGFAEDLANASPDVFELIINQINEVKAVYNEMCEDLRDYQQRYEKEVEKERIKPVEVNNAEV